MPREQEADEERKELERKNPESCRAAPEVMTIFGGGVQLEIDTQLGRAKVRSTWALNQRPL